jgi:hypothetical protein
MASNIGGGGSRFSATGKRDGGSGARGSSPASTVFAVRTQTTRVYYAARLSANADKPCFAAFVRKEDAQAIVRMYERQHKDAGAKCQRLVVEPVAMGALVRRCNSNRLDLRIFLGDGSALAFDCPPLTSDLDSIAFHLNNVFMYY